MCISIIDSTRNCTTYVQECDRERPPRVCHISSTGCGGILTVPAECHREGRTQVRQWPTRCVQCGQVRSGRAHAMYALWQSEVHLYCGQFIIAAHPHQTCSQLQGVPGIRRTAEKNQGRS